MRPMNRNYPSASRSRFPSGTAARPASRAPHASTSRTDIDTVELRNPSAIYTEAERLASQYVEASQTQQPRRVSSASLSGPTPQTQSTVAQTLSRLSALAPHASGSTSTLVRTILKQPMLTQVYLHGSFTSNAHDVLRQFTAELRFFMTVKAHRNIVAFVGSVEGVGMLLEYLDGETLYKWLGRGTPLSVRVDWWNQSLAAVCHIHSFGLAHNDLCSLNVIIQTSSQSTGAKNTTPIVRYTVKIIDFGRSTVEPRPAPTLSPLAALRKAQQSRVNPAPLSASESDQKAKEEALRDLLYPGTRPFASPEVMRAWKASGLAPNQEDGNEDESDDDSSEDETKAQFLHDSFEPTDEALSAIAMDNGMDVDTRDDILISNTEPTVVTPPSPEQDIEEISPLSPTSPPRRRMQMPILSFADEPPAPPITSTSTHPLSTPNHSTSRSGYPSPPPSYISPPSLRSSSPYMHSRPESSTSTSQHRNLSSSSQCTTPSSSTPKRLRDSTIPDWRTLFTTDPRPLSAQLNDTYALGVLALCIAVDNLVDCSPQKQRADAWNGVAELQATLARSPPSASHDDESIIEEREDTWKMFGSDKGPVARYMKGVKERKKCVVGDKLDVDEVKEKERVRRLKASRVQSSVALGASAKASTRSEPVDTPMVDEGISFVDEDGGG